MRAIHNRREIRGFSLIFIEENENDKLGKYHRNLCLALRGFTKCLAGANVCNTR